MSRNLNKRRCTHDACRAWALRGGVLCSIHAGRTRLRQPEVGAEACPTPASPPAGLPTLDQELTLLVERRNRVDEYLTSLLDQGKCTAAEAMRYLGVLAQVSRTLARMLEQRQAAEGDVDQVQRFLEEVEGRVRELAARGE